MHAQNPKPKLTGASPFGKTVHMSVLMTVHTIQHRSSDNLPWRFEKAEFKGKREWLLVIGES